LGHVTEAFELDLRVLAPQPQGLQVVVFRHAGINKPFKNTSQAPADFLKKNTVEASPY
jgi:hypothetical protein